MTDFCKKLNIETGQRLKSIRTDQKQPNGKTLSQESFAEMLGISCQQLSRLENGKSELTQKRAAQIVQLFPNYRLEWLLGYDDKKTMEEVTRYWSNRLAEKGNALITVLDHAAVEAFLREGKNINDIQPLDDIPDLVMLQSLLEEIAIGLMSNYIKWKNGTPSPFWGYLEQTINTVIFNTKNKGGSKNGNNN